MDADVKTKYCVLESFVSISMTYIQLIFAENLLTTKPRMYPKLIHEYNEN